MQFLCDLIILVRNCCFNKAYGKCTRCIIYHLGLSVQAVVSFNKKPHKWYLHSINISTFALNRTNTERVYTDSTRFFISKVCVTFEFRCWSTWAYDCLSVQRSGDSFDPLPHQPREKKEEKTTWTPPPRWCVIRKPYNIRRLRRRR